MIIVDIETTGVNPYLHGIASIGAVDFLKPDRQFYGECRIRDGVRINADSLNINDFTEDQLYDPTKISEKELLENFFAWTDDAENRTMSGHNPGFDLYFLLQACSANSVNFPLAQRTIDLHSVCLMHMMQNKIQIPVQKKRSALNSDTVMKYVGLPTEPKPHNALNGALWEAEAFSRLLYGKKLFDRFFHYPLFNEI